MVPVFSGVAPDIRGGGSNFLTKFYIHFGPWHQIAHVYYHLALSRTLLSIERSRCINQWIGRVVIDYYRKKHVYSIV